MVRRSSVEKRGKLVVSGLNIQFYCDIIFGHAKLLGLEEKKMNHIKTLHTETLTNTVEKGGCGECQTSCQSACKTSCTVGNQVCESKDEARQ